MSKRPRLFLARPLLTEAMELLHNQTEVVQAHPDATLEDLWETCASCDAALVTLTEKFPRQFFETLSLSSPLKIISNYAVGFDNIDVEAARKRNIWVSNTPDVLTEATAELALALILSVSRRIQEGDQLVRSGQWQGWEPTQLLGRSLRGKVLGIVGAGRIGQETARMAKALGLKICYTSRQRKPNFEMAIHAQYMDLEMLCTQADILSIHLPGGSATHHLLDDHHLALMKPSAYVINTGRGTVIDEQALIQALKNSTIAGAGLDVFEHEPALSEHLRALPNVVLTPHIGSATRESRLAMAQTCWKNISAALQGKRPPQAL